MTTNKNWDLGPVEMVVESTNPSLSNNGGEYSFFEQAILLDGEEVGAICTTSSSYSYCEWEGSFGPTYQVSTPVGTLNVGRNIPEAEILEFFK